MNAIIQKERQLQVQLALFSYLKLQFIPNKVFGY